MELKVTCSNGFLYPLLTHQLNLCIVKAFVFLVFLVQIVYISEIAIFLITLLESIIFQNSVDSDKTKLKFLFSTRWIERVHLMLLSLNY